MAKTTKAQVAEEQGPPVYPPIPGVPEPDKARYRLHNGGRVEFLPAAAPAKTKEEVTDA